MSSNRQVEIKEFMVRKLNEFIERAKLIPNGYDEFEAVSTIQRGTTAAGLGRIPPTQELLDEANTMPNEDFDKYYNFISNIAEHLPKKSVGGSRRQSRKSRSRQSRQSRQSRKSRQSRQSRQSRSRKSSTRKSQRRA